MSRKNLPTSIYVERWPESLCREDAIHYAPTGFGIDVQSGLTSRIVEYRRVPVAAKKRKAKAR